MRSLRTFTAWALIGAHAALGAAGGAVVLCVGSDGHVAIEQACEQSCADAGDPTPQIVQAPCCGPCTDIDFSYGESNPWGSRAGDAPLGKIGPVASHFLWNAPAVCDRHIVPRERPPALHPSARRVVFLI